MWVRQIGFWDDDAGAVTTDWIVLSVSLIFLVGFVIAMIHTGSGDIAQDMSTAMASANIVLMDVDHVAD